MRESTIPSFEQEIAMNIQVNAISLHVVDQGSGAPTLLFLHYWGGSSRTWEPVMAALPAAYRCVAPDLRGWGDSAAPADDAYALADMAADIEASIAVLGLRDYVLVGHSMGGKVAQLMASRRPSGLAGLVLVAPAPPVPLDVPPEALAAMQSAYVSRASVGAAIDHMLTATPLPPALREQVIEDSLRGAAGAKLAWPTGAAREDISALVAAIDVPVLVIGGEHDRVDRIVTLQAELLSRLPRAALRVLSGIGHLSPLEAPEQVAQCIVTFLAQLEPIPVGGSRLLRA
jgi:pimeloyl-ACP methyl ester carboxylesterase